MEEFEALSKISKISSPTIQQIQQWLHQVTAKIPNVITNIPSMLYIVVISPYKWNYCVRQRRRDLIKQGGFGTPRHALCRH